MSVLDRDGSFFTRLAYRSDEHHRHRHQHDVHQETEPDPSPIEIPAASEATPVANGFTVDASTPTPAPIRMVPAATMRSYPG